MDAGTNSEIVYSFISGAHQSHFNLNSVTGEIRTKQKLDYETYSKYEFMVEAADKGTPQRNAEVKVIIY